MARKLPSNDNPKEHWLCEFCGRPHIGKDPPDQCEICTNAYFENVHDLLKQSAKATKH